MFIKAISGDSYILNKTISLCFYEDEKKSLGGISNIKSINSLVSVLASIHANEKHYNNAILYAVAIHSFAADNILKKNGTLEYRLKSSNKRVHFRIVHYIFCSDCS